MNNKNTDRDEGWDYCGICGLAYSLSYFTTQRGIKVCPDCKDGDVSYSDSNTMPPVSDERIIA